MTKEAGERSPREQLKVYVNPDVLNILKIISELDRRTISSLTEQAITEYLLSHYSEDVLRTLKLQREAMVRLAQDLTELQTDRLRKGADSFSGSVDSDLSIPQLMDLKHAQD